MRNIKLIIEYDGSCFYGFQKQKNVRTIQEEIEKAIFIVTKEECSLIGSSRTDTGVHARGFVANFLTNSMIPANKFREALNCKLPDDISILYSEEVDLEFHSRYASKGKTYCYTIINREAPLTIERNYAFHHRGKINIEKMKQACEYFIGKHDFKAFKSSGGSTKTTIRTIHDLHIEENDEIIKIYVTGDGFLYNMVRIIVGTLLRVGKEKISPEDIKSIIKSRNREEAGECVSAKGLSLIRVYY